MKRKQLKESHRVSSNYSIADQLMDKPEAFFSTGCTVLDLTMGNGIPLSRIVNVVGDKSTGKTLLAIEAMANFNLKYPQGEIIYLEAEAAFDIKYASSIGFPVKSVEVIKDKDTVDDLFELLTKAIQRDDVEKPLLFIVDSLDALSDRAEKDRDIDQGSYGTNKASKLSQMFRRLVKDLAKTNVTMIIVSQVRDNIGVTFGRKTKRSGGRALDFYASIVIYLAEKKKRTKTIRGVKRVVGVDIIAKCDKNKVSAPFRECEFPITFGYGVEDVESGLKYLEFVKDKKALNDLGFTSSKILLKDIQKVQDDSDFKVKLVDSVRKAWFEFENLFAVSRSKYR